MKSTLIVCFLTLFAAGCATQRTHEKADQPVALSGEVIHPASDFVPSGNVKAASAEYHFSLAQAYVAEANPDRAIEEFKTTLMYDPNSSLVWARLAAEYVKKGMLSAAMEACKEALAHDPKFHDARLMLAGLYSTSRETEQALQEYDRVIQADPSNEEAVLYKAQVLMEDSRAAQAIQELRKFTKRSPGSALGWYYLGKAELQEDHYDEAIAAYGRAIAANENFSQASLALAYAYESRSSEMRAEAEKMSGKGLCDKKVLQNIKGSGGALAGSKEYCRVLDQASAVNNKAIEVYRELFESSQDQTAAGRISTILLKENRFKEALPYLEAQMRQDTEDMNVRVKYGLIQMELKNYEAAIGSFKYILERNPESDRVNFYLANLYEDQKDSASGMAYFRKIGVDSRFYEEAVLHTAFLLKQEGKFAESKTYLSEAILKSPKVPGFYLFQASLEDEEKNLVAAIQLLEKAIELFPENERVRYYLGTLYDRKGDVAKGLFHMETIVKNNPENVDALNYVGYTWTTQGIRLEDAGRLLKKAMSKSPANGYIRDSWGWYLLTRGRISEAVTQLEQAARLKPDEAVILEHLGDAYLRANFREKALQQYQDAAQFADEGLKEKIRGKIQGIMHEYVNDAGVKNHRVPASSPEAQPASEDSP